MEFVSVYIIIVLVSLIAATFVAIVNLKDSKKSLVSLDFRVISTQLVILLTWIMILSQVLRANTPEQAIVNTAVFVLSVVIGGIVIQSAIKENEAAEITRKLITSLTIYNKRLRDLDKQKTEFIGLASHQLRTPNSVIFGYSSMLLEGDFGHLDEDTRATMKKIQKASSNLNIIINELLETSRIESKTAKYNKKRFDIVDLMEELETSLKILADRKNLEFIANFDKKRSIYVNGDREKIKQAISNLLDNALKYTDNGYIKMSVAKGSDHVLISVKDSGIGILPGEIKGIFNKFIRASNVQELDVVGSGLGLFITKEIIIANGGKVWAESEGKHKGSTFNIELPTVE